MSPQPIQPFTPTTITPIKDNTSLIKADQLLVASKLLPFNNGSGTEELTFQMSSTKETESKKSSNSQTKLAAEKVLHRVRAVERIQNLHVQLFGKQAEKRLAENAKKALDHFSQGKTLQEWVTNVEQDPTLTEATLRYAIEEHARENNTAPGTIDTFKKALQELQDKYSKEITAGQNTAVALSAFSSEEERKKLRLLYYETINAQSSAQNIIDNLLKKFGGEDLTKGFMTLLNAINNDLNAMRSSIPKDGLAYLLTDLEKTKKAVSIVQQVITLLKNITVNIPPGKEAFTILLQAINQMTGGLLFAENVNKLEGLVSPDKHPSLLGQVTRMMQALPFSLWPNEEIRMMVLDMLSGRHNKKKKQKKRGRLNPFLRQLLNKDNEN